MEVFSAKKCESIFFPFEKNTFSFTSMTDWFDFTKYRAKIDVKHLKWLSICQTFVEIFQKCFVVGDFWLENMNNLPK